MLRHHGYNTFSCRLENQYCKDCCFTEDLSKTAQVVFQMIRSFVSAADPALQAFSELMESERLFDTGVRRALSSCWLGSDAAEQS